MAVNDFAQTPVGQLTMLIIVWQVIGGQLVHVIGGILIWIAGFYFIYYVMKRRFPDEVIYDEERKNIFGNAAIKRVIKTNVTTPEGWICCYFIVLGMGLISIFTF